MFCRSSLVLFVFLAVSSVVLSGRGLAAELVEVLPLTDDVLWLHFDEGHVDHHKRGEPRSEETVHIQPLDVDAASRPANYKLTSADDPNYRQPQWPKTVNRKSKGTDFAWFADTWVNGRAVNNRPDHTKEHWITLHLPAPLQSGATYKLQTGTVASNGREWTLKFDEKATRSEAIHVNLLGYAPRAPEKFAYIYYWSGDGGSLDVQKLKGRLFDLVDQNTGQSVFSGKVAFRAPKSQQETGHPQDTPPSGSFLNADVCECDFSGFETPGEYVVSVEGVGCSFPFRIDEDVYREAFITTARGLYHNRSGIELTAPYTEFERPAPHNPLKTPGFENKLLYTRVRWQDWGSEGGNPEQLKAQSPGTIESAGFYQDAGDWDSYPTHLRIPQELLFAYQLAPKNFDDGELNIPESGNGIPDILDEAAWLPRFCYRLRHELLDKKFGTGGIGLRIAGDAFGGDEKTLPNGRKVGQGSWDDVDRFWVASGEDPWTTFRYAGTAAHLAHCLKIANVNDPEGVDWEQEARESFDWAVKNRHANDENADLAAHRAYAAAALFQLTGEKRFEDQLQKDLRSVQANTLLADDIRYGAWLYALTDQTGVNQPLQSRVQQAVRSTADNFLIDTREKRAVRWGGNYWMPMLVGQQTTPWVLEGAVAYEITRESNPDRAKQYLAGLYTTCDYFLGTNALNATWVTGLGPRHPQHVFHMDAWYNGTGKFHPGIIPYGPWKKMKEHGQGPWDSDWPNKTVHPHIDQWPGNERWFDNRCCPLSSEFTVHQNTGPAAALFGYLCAPIEQ